MRSNEITQLCFLDLRCYAYSSVKALDLYPYGYGRDPKFQYLPLVQSNEITQIVRFLEFR